MGSILLVQNWNCTLSQALQWCIHVSCHIRSRYNGTRLYVLSCSWIAWMAICTNSSSECSNDPEVWPILLPGFSTLCFMGDTEHQRFQKGRRIWLGGMAVTAKKMNGTSYWYEVMLPLEPKSWSIKTKYISVDTNFVLYLISIIIISSLYNEITTCYKRQYIYGVYISIVHRYEKW